MIEQKVTCDLCKHNIRRDEFNISWFNFTTRNECAGLIHKPNLLECFRHICKDCVHDIYKYYADNHI